MLSSGAPPSPPSHPPHLSNPFSPNYSVIFNFEQKFDYYSSREWMSNRWHQSFYWVALYMVVVFGGQSLMSSRTAYKLRPILVVWNVLLATFSIMGTIRTLPELMHVLNRFGFAHSVCNPSYVEEVKVSGYWTWLFTLSKVPELGDTLFIVLRKQNLLFLHWYHHITVLLFTWYSYSEHISTGRWYINMNYIVHSLMYSYYAARALGFRIPKRIAMVITSSQIIQMIIGGYVTYYAFERKLANEYCNISYSTAKLALIMYGSYFALFAQFFVNSYLFSPNTKHCHKCD